MKAGLSSFDHLSMPWPIEVSVSESLERVGMAYRSVDGIKRQRDKDADERQLDE